MTEKLYLCDGGRLGNRQFEELSPEEKRRFLLATGMLMDELLRLYQNGQLPKKLEHMKGQALRPVLFLLPPRGY